MFCEKCGNELKATDRFCNKCGADLQKIVSPNKSEISNIVSDGKIIIKKFFSTHPASSIEKAKDVKSKIGVFFLILTILLFSLLSCVNITQNINWVLSSLSDSLNSLATTALRGLGSQTALNFFDLEIPLMMGLFISYFLFAIVVMGIVFGAIYFTLKIRRLPLPDINCSLNMLGTSSLPIITALLLNLILGFILPQATLLIFATGAFVSTFFIYESIRMLSGNEYKPIIEMVIIVFLILLVGIIILTVSVNQIADTLQNTFMNEAEGILEDSAGLFADLLRSIF